MDDHDFLTHVVHTERLGPELVEALLDAGVALSDPQRDALRKAPASNRSHRSLPTEAYYDAESFALVAERERLILERYGYSTR